MKQWKQNGKYFLLSVVTACSLLFTSACARKADTAEQDNKAVNEQQETVPVSERSSLTFRWRPFQNMTGNRML